MKLKINLHGGTFKHNKIKGKITSTQNKLPKYIEYVEDSSGSINLFVDRAIYEVDSIDAGIKNYGWLLESHAITKDLLDYLRKGTEEKIKNFEAIFTHNKELIELNDKFKFLHPIGYWVDNISNLKKTKLISMVTSDKRHTTVAKKRYKFAKKNINKIDVFGNGFHSISNKEIGLNSYYFSVVFENDITPDYFSEKLLDCFATKTIPIYYGCKNISKYFDIKGIIDFHDFKMDEITSSMYEDLKKYVNNNFEIVQNYRLPEDAMYKNYLEKS